MENLQGHVNFLIYDFNGLIQVQHLAKLPDQRIYNWMGPNQNLVIALDTIFIIFMISIVADVFIISSRKINRFHHQFSQDKRRATGRCHKRKFKSKSYPYNVNHQFFALHSLLLYFPFHI